MYLILFQADHVCRILLNPLLPGVPFLYTLKTSENLRFSDIFRGYKKEAPGSIKINSLKKPLKSS